MKIEQLVDILTALAKNHPGADVAMSYPARHAGKPTTRRGYITGHRTSIPSHPALRPTIWIELEHTRSKNAEEHPLNGEAA